MTKDMAQRGNYAGTATAAYCTFNSKASCTWCCCNCVHGQRDKCVCNNSDQGSCQQPKPSAHSTVAQLAAMTGVWGTQEETALRTCSSADMLPLVACNVARSK
eukprot:16327-Heterococcus_DN1.PRE.1